jgi:predicted PurR-regulated permease PerM
VPQPDTKFEYLRRLVMVVGGFLLALGLLYLLWRIAHVLLILFAGILGALFIDSLGQLAQRRLRLPRGVAITLAIVVIIAAVTGFGFVVGPQLLEQSRELAHLLPQSIEQLRGWVEHHPWGHLFFETRPRDLIPSPGDLLGQISGVFSTTLGAIASAAIIAILALYLSIEPGPYISGILRLLPPSKRARGQEVLEAIGHALRWWLLGRSVSMLAVGALTAVGLQIIGLPAGLALAVLAGGLSFVPYIGPVAAAVPALLIALPQGPWALLWVMLIYMGIQFLEGNFITPFVQERTVSLPPVVLLTSQLAVGLLFGLLGILLATPLTVIGIVLVQMLYVQDVLGEPIRVLGQHSSAVLDKSTEDTDKGGGTGA